MTKKTRRSFDRFAISTLGLLTLAAAAGVGSDVARAQMPPGKPTTVLAPADSPMALTASDGSGLALVSLAAEVAVEDPLAFTELHLAFRNPENRVREGRFRITLPPGAVVSRFAMRIGNAWQEGEVVERQAAREAYEDALHRRQDPALLETEAGNEFSARVFPIPAQAVKEIILSYSQELPRAAEPYRLPLRGLPAVGSLSIHALVARAPVAGGSPSSLGGRRVRHEAIEVNKTNFTPDRDFEIAERGASAHAGVRNGNLVALRLQPMGAADRPTPVDSLLVLVDTSASRALGFDDEIKRLEALLDELGHHGDPRVTVWAFDQDIETIFTGAASAFGKNGGPARLRAREALGASDFERVLRWAGEVLKKTPHHRVLLVTDAVATAGATAGDKLRSLVKAMGAAGVQRLDVMGVGGIRDDELGRRLTHAGLPQDGLVLDSAAPVATVAQRMGRATRSGIKVRIDGSRWEWPETLDGIQAGDEVLVYADLPDGKRVDVSLDGHPVTLAAGGIETVERPLLERSWVQARMARLWEQRDAVASTDADLAEALQHQVLELSVRHRVLSPLTALLVLETEADYARFHIERRALADILTVGNNGVTVLARTDVAFADSGPVVVPLNDQLIERSAMKGAPAPTAAARRDEGAQRQARAAAKMKDKDDMFEGSQGAGTGAGALEGLASRNTLGGRSAGVVAASPPAPAMEREADMSTHRRAREEAPRMASPKPEPARPAPPMPSATPPMPSAAPQMAMSSPAPAPAIAAELAPPSARPSARSSGAPPSGALIERSRHGGVWAPSEMGVAPLTGEMAQVMDLLAHHRRAEALARASAWHRRELGDVLALVALGEALEAGGQTARAARAYGSLIDLFPSRADLRRFAGGRLERLGSSALVLAIDTFRKAALQRPDHPAGARMLAFALIKTGRPAEAFDVLTAALRRGYPAGRFAGVERILREDLALAGAAWRRADSSKASLIAQRLQRAGVSAEDQPSVRFVLTWETDANDVDFHVWDGRGGHAFYSQPRLSSGGALYADVTTGYGPECFTVREPNGQRATPYRLRAHYYSRGPMGYGMGKLQIIDHDGQGGLHFEERPFVIMQDNAFVDLGWYGSRGGNEAALAGPR